ncbi:MAG: 16S rRNA (cytidine(1402)-2'-O)-methyltransferase [Mycobacteriales bacterium]|nr:16S rRNA (cytidine(1402)-2'-O)-methyltransferase [Frankia sp.]
MPPRSRAPSREPAGLLIFCGAPIGNVADASARLAATLAEVDIVAAEDTRRLHRLARHLGVDPHRVVSLFEGNETARTAELLGALRAGQTVAVITDGGMPTVSDPGYRLAHAAAGDGIRISVVPGPSAVTAALAVSGLPTDRWCMEGFLPRKAGERRRRLAELAAEPRTLVFFEAPHRAAAMLRDLASEFGPDRPATACRELTKTWEEIRPGSLGELADWADEGVRGEITVVVAGAADTPGSRDPSELAALVLAREAEGVPRKEAIGRVAADARVAKRVVYDAVLAERRSASSRKSR